MRKFLIKCTFLDWPIKAIIKVDMDSLLGQAKKD